MMEGGGAMLRALTRGAWPAAVFVSELVQTGILADFCYHYVRAYAGGKGGVFLPV